MMKALRAGLAAGGKTASTASGKSRRRWLKWIVLGPLLLVLLIQLYFFVTILWWTQFNPSSTSMMRQQLSVLREKNPNAKLEQVWVPYERISDNLKRAVIASEDANFTEHDGVDWEALEKAWQRNNKRHKVIGGGSTITQQLAKNLFLSNERTLDRKIREAFLALWLESHFTKDQILKLYLDRAYLGGGVFGVEAAAQFYFGKPAHDLTLAESAMIAGLFKAPSKFAPHRRHPAPHERR
jgi:monofunctional biosynthetic peptidoglycan transglycosylase